MKKDPMYNINFSKVVPRSDDWSREELTFFIENYFTLLV